MVVMEIDGRPMAILELKEYAQREGIARATAYWRCRVGAVRAEQYLRRWLVFLPVDTPPTPQGSVEREETASLAAVEQRLELTEAERVAIANRMLEGR